ncbi:hypothetical protein EDC18_11159 [Natranaerovirga pectinivora]|uniref:DUF4352 domain-containing protein n=1 Tax=Natranaerovirga pectinivora TaxID=682400 RepID=A0A4R3MG70_9FIRM|nr:hypothetical protein [Natranaerovirga pectinivora]TCT12888.1 hypothetical protein EDC18_11159 [Natranaerovirga pectinivora]
MYRKLIIGTLILVFSITGCRVWEQLDDDPTEKYVVENISNENGKRNELQQKNDKMRPGNSFETEEGSFFIHALKDNIEKIRTGPIEIEIESAQVVSGQIKGEIEKNLKKDQIHYVLIDLVISNYYSSEVSFHPERSIITTNTEEIVENANMLLSDDFGGALKGEGTKRGKLVYLLEGDPGYIEWITVKIASPYNPKTKERLGDDLEFRLRF